MNLSRAVVRNIKTNDLYLHLEGNKFRNLRTGVEGEIPEPTLKNIFKINMEATIMIGENPLIEKLINICSLKIDK